MRLQEYTYTLIHRPAEKCVNVDFLSRYPKPSTAGPVIEPLYAPIATNTHLSSLFVVGTTKLRAVGTAAVAHSRSRAVNVTLKQHPYPRVYLGGNVLGY